MSPILQFLDELFSRHRECREGHVATYIPELAKVDPEKFGICVATIDGHVYEVGDSRHPFTIQSISKPFVYGLALDDHGPMAMARKVGVEPSGDAFNAISLRQDDGRPLNPMINAGAIATTGQIVAGCPRERFDRILAMFGRHAGRALACDAAVYESEARTGHRNRAIGHLLRNYDVLIDEPTPTVDVYFRQCSILVTCHDLAIMAATLANQGVNPVTGERALKAENVESVLSVMASCGMYDSSGAWIYDVGMPAKSGVGGGVLAVLPGQFGIGVFSPRLDEKGNSVRAVRVCVDLSRAWGLHQFNPPYCPHTSRRHSYSCRERQSTRARCPEEIDCLRSHGLGIRIIEVQGVLSLATTEPVLREILALRNGLRCLIVDFRHTTGINAPAAAVLTDLARLLRDDGVRILFTNTTGVPILAETLNDRLPAGTTAEILYFRSLDHAMESCEDDLLRAVRPEGLFEARAVEESELAVGMTPGELAIFTSLLRARRYASREIIVRRGDTADTLFLITRGVIAVHLGDGPDAPRTASFSAGTMVGGMAFIDGGPRSATLVAEGDLECVALERADFEMLQTSHPHVHARLLRNIAVSLAMKLRLANEHLDTLSKRTR
ncbi:MAG: glutaminase A [Planctomycetia bacterium]